MGRAPGIKLDPLKVKAWAQRKNIVSLKVFQYSFDDYIKDPAGKKSSAPENAWKGNTMDVTHASNVAVFLECSLEDLLSSDEVSGWTTLTTNPDYKQDFVDIVVKEENELYLIESVHEISDREQDLPSVSIDSRFKLRIKGSRNDRITAFILSRDSVHMIAPLDMKEGYDHVLLESELTYPNIQAPAFKFKEEDGFGWRCIVVIRSPLIRVTPRQDVTLPLNQTEMDILSNKILISHANEDRLSDLAVDVKEFNLVI